MQGLCTTAVRVAGAKVNGKPANANGQMPNYSGALDGTRAI